MKNLLIQIAERIREEPWLWSDAQGEVEAKDAWDNPVHWDDPRAVSWTTLGWTLRAVGLGGMDETRYIRVKVELKRANGLGGDAPATLERIAAAMPA